MEDFLNLADRLSDQEVQSLLRGGNAAQTTAFLRKHLLGDVHTLHKIFDVKQQLNGKLEQT